MDGTVIAASGRHGRWLSRLLSPDRAALGETPDRCAAAGLGLSVERVFGLDEGRYGLTGEQGSVLRMAFERGYYAIPRETAVQDLASEMWVLPTRRFRNACIGPTRRCSETPSCSATTVEAASVGVRNRSPTIDRCDNRVNVRTRRITIVHFDTPRSSSWIDRTRPTV